MQLSGIPANGLPPIDHVGTRCHAGGATPRGCSRFLCVPSVQDISVNGCKWYEIITVNLIYIIQVKIRRDSNLSCLFSISKLSKLCQGFCKRGEIKQVEGNGISFRSTVQSSGFWLMTLTTVLQCHSCHASWSLFPLVYPLTQAPRCPCPQTSFVASPQPNGNNSGN